MTDDERDRCIRLLRDIVVRHIYGPDPGDPVNLSDVELVELDRLLAGKATPTEETTP